MWADFGLASSALSDLKRLFLSSFSFRDLQNGNLLRRESYDAKIEPWINDGRSKVPVRSSDQDLHQATVPSHTTVSSWLMHKAL